MNGHHLKTTKIDCRAIDRGRRAVVRAVTGAVVVTLAAPLEGFGADAKTVEIVIKQGQVVGAKSVRVAQGDIVILRWTSDTAMELHLHGYDIETNVAPGKPAAMRVEARATGRFPVEVHNHGKERGRQGHAALFHLEVYPK